MAVPEYIIVQAGGKGSRMGHLTHNKPKALVPVDNLPMIFHLFRRYPASQFIIIGDTHFETLEKYLTAFADVNYKLIRSSGKEGTCAGLYEALANIPDETPFMIIWSDLVLGKDFTLPEGKSNYIGVAKDFRCRWRFVNGALEREPSSTDGVAGLFYFQDAAQWRRVPREGAFVRWLSTLEEKFEALPIYGMKEFGLLSEYQKKETARCRPFNDIEICDDRFIKKPRDSQGKFLNGREINWYKKASDLGFQNIPRLHSFEPLTMELIKGHPIYEVDGLSALEKLEVLEKIVDCLKELHSSESAVTNTESIIEAYLNKTFKRLEKVRYLAPFANDREIIINGVVCKNVFFHEEELREKILKCAPQTFKFIHGDCTFSNMMLRDDAKEVVLIDPRGYFGKTELFGDPDYDWAKLYYSLNGNYDQFNRKRFSLSIEKNEALISVDSNGWEFLGEKFWHMLPEGEGNPEKIKLLHALIWLSLTTYAWEDYDAICAAFYNGIYLLKDILK